MKKRITPAHYEKGFNTNKDELAQWLEERASEMRKHPTEAELTFGDVLRRNRIQYKFQAPIIVKQKYGQEIGWTGYIADYLVGNVVYEIDGGYHRTHNQQLLDKIRDMDMRRAGYRVIRLTNKQVKNYKL